jgi:tripartite-type tricarboxylate transporter receptor subunit TctC
MLRLAVATVSMLAVLPAMAAAQDKVAQFYGGRTVDFYIGSTVGGGFNAYARAVGRHIMQYLPGKPNVVFKNMAGAGGRKVTDYIANVAPRDGSAIVLTQPGALVEPIFGDPKKAKYDPLKFGYIGSPETAVTVCFARTDAPVKTFAELFKTPLVVGANQRGSFDLDFSLALRNLLGIKLKIVKGYKGSRDIIVALENNEVQGICGHIWSSLMSQAGHLVRDRKVNILVQYALEPNPEASRLGAPMIWDYVKDPEKRKVLELLADQLVFGRPIFTPPGVPADRLKALRTAFDRTMKDPGYLAEAKKQKLDVSPASGERVTEMVRRMFAAPKALQAAARDAMYKE